MMSIRMLAMSGALVLAAAMPAGANPPAARMPGSGVLVCDLRTANAGLRDLGIGCGRWLHLVVGGHSELAQTPPWGALNRAQHELHRGDLAIDLRESEAMRRILGVSYVCIGTLTGSVAACELRIAAYRLPEPPIGPQAAGPPVPIGTALSARGMPDQVVAALPDLARRLSILLGVNRPRTPASAGVNAAELALLGSVARLDADDVPWRQAKMLIDLSARCPLAAVLALQIPTVNDPGVVDANLLPNALAASAPVNSLAFAQAARCSGALSNAYLSDASAARCGRCLATAFGSALANDRRGLDAPAIRAAVTATQRAPGSPDAWAVLAVVHCDAAGRARQGRSGRWVFRHGGRNILEHYRLWYLSAQRELALDPEDGAAWYWLAMAQTFACAGDPEEALWKAVDRFGYRTEPYTWGLEMFQPKWLDRPKSLLKIGRLATDRPFHDLHNSVPLAYALYNAGLGDLARKVALRALEQGRALAKEVPADLYVRAQLQNMALLARNGGGKGVEGWVQ
jgi:hypothetical protein